MDKYKNSLIGHFFLLNNQRGGRDSNPRSRFNPDNHLAGDPVQPLRHLPRCPTRFNYLKQAEGEGFEPTMAFTIPVFKTGALNHSAIPPGFCG
jgi:hypothetical protein